MSGRADLRVEVDAGKTAALRALAKTSGVRVMAPFIHAEHGACDRGDALVQPGPGLPRGVIAA